MSFGSAPVMSPAGFSGARYNALTPAGTFLRQKKWFFRGSLSSEPLFRTRIRRSLHQEFSIELNEMCSEALQEPLRERPVRQKKNVSRGLNP
jgi:hypothetical protein